MTEKGYTLDRDGAGLTKRERQALALLREGLSQFAAAEQLGVTKQRMNQLTKALVKKGVLAQAEDGSIWMRVTA